MNNRMKKNNAANYMNDLNCILYFFSSAICFQNVSYSFIVYIQSYSAQSKTDSNVLIKRGVKYSSCENRIIIILI